MKLVDRPPQRDARVKEPRVNLMSITPDLVKVLGASGRSTSIPEELLALRPEPYRVGPQDTLIPTVWDHPEISLPLGEQRTESVNGMVVDDRGEIFFPHIGPLPVAGLTIPEIRKTLTERLSVYIRRPQVDIKVIAYRSKKVYVSGEVRNPSLCAITDVPMTLAEAIHRCGGLLPTADNSRIILTRGPRSWALDFQASLESGGGMGRLLLQHGDTLFVPSLQDEPVYLLGELGRTGVTPRRHGQLSLARAIADAGGISGTSADARSVYVIRQAKQTDAVDVFHLDARSPTAMVLADRFPLKPRDVVYVDAGTLVRFSRVMNLVLPTVSAITASAVSGADVHYLLRESSR